LRDYGIVSWQFWTGSTGKQLRTLGRDEQVVAIYLMTCPSSNMIGMYYLPIVTMAHETGITPEGASKALRRVCATGFACYDEASEYVYVPEMARWQISEELKPSDKQVKGILNEVKRNAKCPYVKDFWHKYADAFCLGEPPKEAAPTQPIPSPPEAPSEPLRSQDQEQKHLQDQGLKTLIGSSSLTAKRMREFATPAEKSLWVQDFRDRICKIIGCDADTRMFAIVGRVGEGTLPEYLVVDAAKDASDKKHPADYFVDTVAKRERDQPCPQPTP